MPGVEEEGQGPGVMSQAVKGIGDAPEKADQGFMFYKYISYGRAGGG